VVMVSQVCPCFQSLGICMAVSYRVLLHVFYVS
jgi:hypothetical protein